MSTPAQPGSSTANATTQGGGVDVPSQGVDGQDQSQVKWGRVLIAGGVDWLNLGKKDIKPVLGNENLYAPHILRALGNVKMTKIFSGPSAMHCVGVDVHGNIHLIGRNSPSSVLGVPASQIPFSPYTPKPSATPVSKVKGKQPEPESSIPVVIKILASDLVKSSSSTSTPTKIIGAACARHHTLIVGSCGRVWACGNNSDGRLGLPMRQKGEEVGVFTQVRGPWEADKVKVVQVSAGISFSLFLTEDGKVYASGSHENGQCGNGQTGGRLSGPGKMTFDNDDEPRLIRPFSKTKVVAIASGHQHSLAMDEEGLVWAWGYAGYGRLGLGDQVDKKVPTMVTQFARGPHSRALEISCGPACSIVIDAQRMYQIAGKWKNTGDGSSGSPYTYFKPIQEIVSCKIIKAVSGGNGHFLIIPSEVDGKVTSVGFGQNSTNGELGLGVDQPRNSTKPVEIQPLRGVDVFDVAAAGATTYWIAQPGTDLESLDRWPLEVASSEECLGCGKDSEQDDSPMVECEKCESAMHLKCHKPVLSDVPEGEWFCPRCAAEQDDSSFVVRMGGSNGAKADTDKAPKSGKRKAEDPIEAPPSKGAGGSKRAPPKKR